jgi:hypothetical protein
MRTCGCRMCRPLRARLRFAWGSGLCAEEDRHIADERHEFALCAIGDFRGERFLLLFEVREFHLHQLMRRERFVHAFQERFGDSRVTELDGGFEALGAGLQGALFRIGEGVGHWRQDGRAEAG